MKPGCSFRVLGFEGLGLGFRVSAFAGLGFRVSGVWGSGFRASGFGFRFRVQGARPDVARENENL